VGARVALIVDHPLRDLDGMILVALRLASSGVTSYLVPYNAREPELWELAPDLALLNSARSRNDPLVTGLTSSGCAVVVLDTEGGVTPGVEYYLNLVSSNAEVRRRIAAYLSWGSNVATGLIDHGLFEPAQVRVTGNPRFDLYSPPWIRANDVPQKTGDSPLVLFVGNFSIGNPEFGSAEAVARAQVQNERFSAEDVREWQAKQLQALDGLVKLANLTAETFPETKVVVRPHPFESMTRYREQLENLPNLELTREGSIQSLLPRTSLVVQRGCTTAIEAALTGVPALSARWLPMHWEIPSTEAVSVPCDSPDDVLDAVRALVNGQFRVPPTVAAGLQQVIGAWFRAADGSSHEHVADAVLDVLRKAEHAPDRPAMRESAYGLRFGSRTVDGWRRVSRWLKMVLGLPPQFSFRRIRTVSGYSGWRASAKAYSVGTVREAALRLAAAAQEGGHAGFKPFSVAGAGTGDYLTRYEGLSVKIAPVV